MVKRVMMIAGEASGDLHGSGVVRELKRLQKNVDVYGVGGENMRREGMHLIFHIKELGFMGFVEVLKHLPFIKVMQHTLEQILKFKKPDVLVLIDYPGFNLRFARVAKKYGVKIIYYISPQVWAWHRSRVREIRELVDKMLVIFPFEVDFYKKEDVDVEFVGHPVLEALGSHMNRKNFCKRYGIDGNRKILGLLPGSRRQEVENILPVMLSAAKRIAYEANMEVAVGVAPTLEEKYFRTFFPLNGIHLVSGATYELMDHSDFAIVTSGTATLETACFETPMFVVYKTSWLTYLIGRLLIRVRNIGMVNIVAGKQIVPEFVQHGASVKNLVREAVRLLGDETRLSKMKADLSKVKSLLGEVGASRRVADRILKTA